MFSWFRARPRSAEVAPVSAGTPISVLASSVPESTLDAPTYRAKLIASVLVRDPRLADALRLIESSLAAVSDTFEREHLPTHIPRWLMTIALMPDGPGDLLDIGSVSYYASALSEIKGWRMSTVEILAIDYETEPLPVANQSVDAVFLGEVIEHFVLDPLFALHEINRVLKSEGSFVITTPNAASWFSVYQVLNGCHPARWPVYSGNPVKARNHIHAREYTVPELCLIVEAAGFTVEEVTTLDYGIAPPYRPIPGFSEENRGETIFLRARKSGPPKYRYVQPIYLESEPYGLF